MTETPDPDAPDSAVWWPISAVATPRLGISRDLMVAAIDRGELPIRRASFGARGLVYVARVDVLAYLNSFLSETTE